MNKHDPIVCSILGTVFGSALIWNGWKRFRRAQEIENSAISHTATAAQGTTELQGYAWPTTPFRAPLSNLPVVFYHLIIEEERGSGKNRRWVKIAEEKIESPFFLVDATGMAVVNLKKFETELRWVINNWSSLDSTRQDGIQQLVSKKNPTLQIGDAGIIFKRPVRLRECTIPVGSPVCAYGYFESSNQGIAGLIRPAIGLKGFMEQVLGLESQVAATPVTIDIAQKMLAVGGGTPIIIPAHASSVQSPWERPHGQIHELTDEPLYIADCWRQELLSRIGHWNVLRMLAGAALIAASSVVAYLRHTGQIHPF